METAAAAAAATAAAQIADLQARVLAIEGAVNPLATRLAAVEGVTKFVRTEMPQVRLENKALHAAMAELTAQSKASLDQLDELSARADRMARDHLQLRTEMLDTTEEMKKLRGGCGRTARGVDLKALIPSSYKPSSDDASVWRDFPYKTRSYLAKAIDPAISAILTGAEVRKDEIKAEHIAGLGMQPEWEVALRAFLNGTTEGEAFSTVRAGEKLPALEVWRQLADNSDPITDGRSMNDLQTLLDWPKCRELSKVRAHIQDWEDAVMQYESRSGEKFQANWWRVALLKILPT